MCVVCVLSNEAIKEIATIQKLKCDNIFSAICSGGATDDNVSRFNAATEEYALIAKGLVLSRVIGFSGKIPNEHFVRF